MASLYFDTHLDVDAFAWHFNLLTGQASKEKYLSKNT